MSFVAQLVRRVKNQLQELDAKLRRSDSARLKKITDFLSPIPWYSRNASLQISVHIFEQNDKIGPGLAYGALDTQTCPAHLINLYASTMSPIPDSPGDFVDWLKCNSANENLKFDSIDEAPDADDFWSQPIWKAYRDEFPPRAQFGEYLQYVFQRALAEADIINKSAKVSMNIHTHLNSLVYSLEPASETSPFSTPSSSSTSLSTNTSGSSSGGDDSIQAPPRKTLAKTSIGLYLQDFLCDYVVIATGHISIPPPCVSDHFVHASSKFVESPWPIRTFIELVKRHLTLLHCRAHVSTNTQP